MAVAAVRRPATRRDLNRPAGPRPDLRLIPGGGTYCEDPAGRRESLPARILRHLARAAIMLPLAAVWSLLLAVTAASVAAVVTAPLWLTLVIQ